MRELKESMPDDARNNCWWTRPRKDFPYQMKCKTTVDESDPSRTFHTRWCTQPLLLDKADEEYHSRCTKKLWMEEADERVHTRWCTTKLSIDVMMDYPYQMMYETIVDGSDQRRTDHTRWCTKQLLMVETKKSIPDDARNNCLWMLPMKDYPHQMLYKQLLMDEKTEGIHDRCCTKELLMGEADEGIHTRWCMKQLLTDDTNQGLPTPDHVQTTADG